MPFLRKQEARQEAARRATSDGTVVGVSEGTVVEVSDGAAVAAAAAHMHPASATHVSDGWASITAGRVGRRITWV